MMKNSKGVTMMDLQNRLVQEEKMRIIQEHLLGF